MTMSVQQPAGGKTNQDPLFTLSPADSPANPSQPLASAGVRRTNGGDGPGCSTSFAHYDPTTSSWKTWQLSLMTPTPSDGCSVTWPTSGSMRNGQCYRHAPWVHHTCVIGCSWWPTPTAVMGRRGWGLGRYDQGRYRRSTIERVHGVITSIGHWRPPVLMIERLMGLPDRWLLPEETRSSPTSPSSSAG